MVTIKSRMKSKFDQARTRTAESAAIERLESLPFYLRIIQNILLTLLSDSHASNCCPLGYL